MGRKKLPDGKARTAQLQIRVTPEFKVWIEECAAINKETITDSIVIALKQRAKRNRAKGNPEPPSDKED